MGDTSDIKCYYTTYFNLNTKSIHIYYRYTIRSDQLIYFIYNRFDTNYFEMFDIQDNIDRM